MPTVSPQTAAVAGAAATALLYWQWSSNRQRALSSHGRVTGAVPIAPSRLRPGENEGYHYDATTDTKKLKGPSFTDPSGGGI